MKFVISSLHSARNITRTARDVLHMLAHWQGRPPTQKQLAGACRCSVRSVRYAIAQGVALGILTVRPQFHRIGRHKRRTVNQYIWHKVAVSCRILPPWARGKFCRTHKVEKHHIEDRPRDRGLNRTEWGEIIRLMALGVPTERLPLG